MIRALLAGLVLTFASVAWAQEFPILDPDTGMVNDGPFGLLLPEATPGLPAEPGIATAEGQEQIVFLDAPLAILRGLDTVNGTVHEFEVAVGETVRYERLEITLNACRYPVDDIAGEAYAFLEIHDSRETAARFSGWMLASSPALSALDHPRYDVWVLSCKID